MIQRIVETDGHYELLDSWFGKNHAKCAMLVCGKSITRHKINDYLEELPARLDLKIVRFMDFQPNPLYENIQAGVKLFRKKRCDSIIAIGGGSAMDVAKCIKLYSNLSGYGENGVWLKADIMPNDIPFLAMPTTAGTGSESTRFAVIYYNKVKQSISDFSCIPATVLLDASVLKTLPEYQRKATMMDAFCHAIESFWSVNSTEESREYSGAAIRSIMGNMESYLANTDSGNAGMLLAANMAGKAINITQTTAGHAMCYKITSMFGCAHGHAAALCDRILYAWMTENVDKCSDPRGEEYLRKILNEIGVAMGCDGAKTGSEKLNRIFERLAFDVPIATTEQHEELKTSVNPVRLKNHPIKLTVDTIDCLYHDILR